MPQKNIRQGTLVTEEYARALEGWRRAFYGRSVPRGGHPAGLAAAVTGYLSTLVTAELEVSVSGGRRARFLSGAMEHAKPLMQQAVQIAAAEGACVLRPQVRDGRLAVELIPASRYFPIRLDAAGNPEAGFLADFRTHGRDQVVRLESFDFRAGRLTVENRAYKMKGDTLEREIPLDSLEAWAELEKSVEIEGVSGPLMGVLRMPFPGWAPDCPLPGSLYAGAEQSLLEFDRLYGEFLYELHSGKRKRILERQALPGLSGKSIPGGIGYQDLTADTYLVLDPMEQQKPFDDYSPVLRTEGYLSALKSLLRLIENQCRLSPGSLSLEVSGQSPVTATEVVSRDRTTYHTCAAVQEQGLRPALTGLLRAMDALADLYGLCAPGDWEAAIRFGDSVFEDTGAEFDRLFRLTEAGILKPEKLLGWYFGVDEARAAQEYLKQGGSEWKT